VFHPQATDRRFGGQWNALDDRTTTGLPALMGQTNAVGNLRLSSAAAAEQSIADRIGDAGSDNGQDVPSIRRLLH
jgi:hypothetical protein